MSSTSGHKKYMIMNKKDVRRLIDLIESSPILLSKETNAATNKLKEEAWVAVTDSFNERSTIPRNTVQLKLKWDNLKKAARKRAQSLKTKADVAEIKFIAPDITLDRVMNIIGFGGYIEYDVEIDKDNCAGLVDDPDASESEPDEHLNHSSNDATQERKIVCHDLGNESISDMENSFNIKAQKRKPECDNIDNEVTNGETKSKPQKKIDDKKKMKSAAQRAKFKKAIARYYELKSEKLMLEIELLKKSLNEADAREAAL